ncbi:hypothetical protein GF312_05695 [Candidatus Poribacteria bacterium]|nr:hypothetical protein [Candidatus Poribacteria bacterium]
MLKNADKFQPRYQLHEYPGRKPWYVIRNYINEYSKPGDTILDPFCGSGVVLCESLITRRKALGVDIDPVAVFISGMTCISPIQIKQLKKDFQKIAAKAKDKIYEIYAVPDLCDRCGGKMFASRVARLPGELALKATCLECNKHQDSIISLSEWEIEGDIEIPYWYPKDIKLPSDIQGNIKYLHKLYTIRNLKALSILWQSLNLVKDEIIRELFRLCFSANLSKSSSMNVPKKTGKGWTSADYEVYNIPDNFIEFNVWEGFANKFQLCLQAKSQTNDLIGDYYNYETFKLFKSSSEKMSFLSDDSVDYVLTDPPYADLVKYHDRNFVRRAWLGYEHEYKFSIYPVMMKNVFKEITRVLKSEGYVSIMLKDTSKEFRRDILEIAGSSGLVYDKTDRRNLGYGNKHVDHVINLKKGKI